jgi:hypothetical protein
LNFTVVVGPLRSIVDAITAFAVIDLMSVAMLQVRNVDGEGAYALCGICFRLVSATRRMQE